VEEMKEENKGRGPMREWLFILSIGAALGFAIALSINANSLFSRSLVLIGGAIVGGIVFSFLFFVAAGLCGGD